jgi:eukaryotic-like serine/threonine-protein kinase
MTASDSSDPDKLVGAILGGRWRLLRMLGQGGMGAVYAAEGLQGQGIRAVKLLHPEFRKEASIVERFFAEAQTSVRLTHPGVVRVDGAATAEDGSPYLVMELLEGKSLDHVIEPGQAMPLGQISFILDRLLDTLQYAHQSGVVHRDLKPENLFLVPQPGGGHAIKIVDFGIAKVMDAAGGMGSKTRTGMMLGTPGYMSPEQMRNAKLSDPRSDLWSVGVMAYEMVSGVDPFPAADPFAKLMRVLSNDPPALRTVRPDLAPLEPFFARALSRDPAGRFQSATEMGAAWRSAVAALHGMPAPGAPAPGPPKGTVAMPQVASGPAVSLRGPVAPGGTAQIVSAYAPTAPIASVAMQPSMPVSMPHGPPNPMHHASPNAMPQGGPPGSMHQGGPPGSMHQGGPPGSMHHGGGGHMHQGPGAPMPHQGGGPMHHGGGAPMQPQNAPGQLQHGARGPNDRPELITQLSHLRPTGAPTPVPTLQPDQVRVVPPPPLPPRGLQLKVIWVLAFAAACIIVGVGIGLILANR